MKQIILTIFIALVIIGCSRTHPVYEAKPNTYIFNHSLDNNGKLISESLVYTFTVESLETIYTKSFCGGLKNCAINIKNVQQHPEFGGFDLNKKPITNNATGTTTVDLHRILYTTIGQKNELLTVSGAVFMPNINSKKIKGVVLFFHKTYLSKHVVPSYGYTRAVQDAEVAAILATQGYIVIAPDYIGQGFDTKTVHPYILYPQVNAIDGLSMLVALRTFFKNNNLFTNKDLPLLVSGYSEGGSYALWFSRLYQEQSNFKKLTDNTGFKLTQVSPMLGPYDLSGVIFNSLLSNITFLNKGVFNADNSSIAGILKPGLLAMAMVGYAHYNEKNNYNKVFNPDFFNMRCTLLAQDKCDFSGKHVNLLDALSQDIDETAITIKISNAASYKIANGSIYTEQTNNISPLINTEILKNKDFINLIHNADIYYWKSTIPTALIYLQKDSVVSSYNATYAYRGMLANNSTNLTQIGIDNDIIKVNISDYLPDQGVNHVVALPHLLLIVVDQFNKILQR
jgi:hypothetical protein